MDEKAEEETEVNWLAIWPSYTLSIESIVGLSNIVVTMICSEVHSSLLHLMQYDRLKDAKYQFSVSLYRISWHKSQETSVSLTFIRG